MENDDWGAAEPLRQAIHDLVHKFTMHIGPPQPSQTDHDKAVQQMNDQAQQQRVQDANKSFIKPDVAADIRKKAAK